MTVAPMATSTPRATGQAESWGAGAPPGGALGCGLGSPATRQPRRGSLATQARPRPGQSCAGAARRRTPWLASSAGPPTSRAARAARRDDVAAVSARHEDRPLPARPARREGRAQRGGRPRRSRCPGTTRELRGTARAPRPGTDRAAPPLARAPWGSSRLGSLRAAPACLGAGPPPRHQRPRAMGAKQGRGARPRSARRPRVPTHPQAPRASWQAAALAAAKACSPASPGPGCAQACGPAPCGAGFLCDGLLPLECLIGSGAAGRWAVAGGRG